MCASARLLNFPEGNDPYLYESIDADPCFIIRPTWMESFSAMYPLWNAVLWNFSLDDSPSGSDF